MFMNSCITCYIEAPIFLMLKYTESLFNSNYIRISLLFLNILSNSNFHCIYHLGMCTYTVDCRIKSQSVMVVYIILHLFHIALGSFCITALSAPSSMTTTPHKVSHLRSCHTRVTQIFQT